MPPRITARAASRAAAGSEARITDTNRCVRAASNTSRAPALGLVLLAWAAVAILLPPARATQIVRDQLAKTLSRDVRFDRVSISLWPPVRIAVKKFELAEPGGFESGTACSVGAVQLDVDALALLVHRVVVRRLTLDGPALHLRLGEDGRTNFDGMGAAPQPQVTA